MRHKRYRVTVRRRVTVERLVQQGALAAVLVLAGLAFLAVRQTAARFPGWEAALGFTGPAAQASWEGVPEALEPRVRSMLARGFKDSSAAAQALREAFPCFKSVTVKRDWLRRGVRFVMEPHKAVARVGARGSRYLSDAGDVFSAPAGLYSDGLASVELGAASEPERARLAGVLSAIAKSPLAQSAASSARPLPKAEGWEVRFADGTRVLWGPLSLTEEKLRRLAEVLRDARTTIAGGIIADLRYFEDGRILVRRDS